MAGIQHGSGGSDEGTHIVPKTDRHGMPFLTGTLNEWPDLKRQCVYICLRLFQIAIEGDFGQHNSGKQIMVVGPLPQYIQSGGIGTASGRFVTSQQFNVGKPCFCYRYGVLDFF